MCIDKIMNDLLHRTDPLQLENRVSRRRCKVERVHTATERFVTVRDVKVDSAGNFGAFSLCMDAEECGERNNNESERNATEHGGVRRKDTNC